MTEFTMKLAGKVIAVAANHPSTREFCREYLWDGVPELAVTVTQEDIDSERIKSAKEDELEGIAPRQFTDAYLETLALYRKIAGWMLQHDTMLFHGSAIGLDGEGYLFTAKSGTGKSTHTRLWRETFGSRTVMVNDDKPLLQITEDGVRVHGTPWNGKHKLGANMDIPLKAICILERGTENQIRQISPREALPMLLQQSYRPKDRAAMAQLLELLGKLIAHVKLYKLQCNMDPQAAVISAAAMSGRNMNEITKKVQQ